MDAQPVFFDNLCFELLRSDTFLPQLQRRVFWDWAYPEPLLAALVDTVLSRCHRQGAAVSPLRTLDIVWFHAFYSVPTASTLRVFADVKAQAMTTVYLGTDQHNYFEEFLDQCRSTGKLKFNFRNSKL
jgi:hypothetical protein